MIPSKLPVTVTVDPTALRDVVKSVPKSIFSARIDFGKKKMAVSWDHLGQNGKAED